MIGQGRAARRAGFSLVELLVVISLIAILAAMTAGGIGRARTAAIRAQAAAEISQLGNAIGAFKAKYNVAYIPSTFHATGNYSSAPAGGLNSESAQYLKLLFPQIDLADTGLSGGDLNGNRTLVLFLSGGTATGYTGIFPNRQYPFKPPTPGAPGAGPFFDFPAGRLDGNPPQYKDPWGRPYAYASSQGGGGYSVTFEGMTPFKRGGRFEQQKGFQIVSAGPNNEFGPGGEWSPGSGNYAPGSLGGDDLVNFTSGQLAYAQ